MAAASEGELARSGQEDGLEELVWALVLHEGPLEQAQLARRVVRSPEQLETILGALLEDGRVERRSDGLLSARTPIERHKEPQPAAPPRSIVNIESPLPRGY